MSLFPLVWQTVRPDSMYGLKGDVILWKRQPSNEEDEK